MSKTYKKFHFKQFSLQQNRAAMKIGTDGILLGAWINIINAKNALDIGTGTGVIAIMQAQKNSALIIDAVEIESNACIDAKKNFENSPWSDRLILHSSSLRNFEPKKTYDCIVSNPPFFNNSLNAANNNRTLARHADSLHYEDILAFSVTNLNKNGTLSMILPTLEALQCIIKAKENGFYLSRKCNVFPNPLKDQHRTLLEFTKNKCKTIEKNIIIETDKRHDYTNEYKSLTKNFYIIFD